MNEIEDILTAVVAKWLAFLQGESEEKGQPLLHPALARLLAAMMISCKPSEDCGTCTIGGLGICIFERSDDEPPTPCLAKTGS